MMRVNTMRHIDRFLGVPLCWVAGMMSGFGKGETKNLDPGNIHTILIIKFFGLGSVLLTTPALQIMRGYFPSARIIYLTFETNRELLERLECINEILAIRTNHFSTFVRDTAAVIAKLNHLHVDIVFDFEFFSKFSTLISALSRAPVRAGFSLPARWREKIVTHPVLLDKAVHVSETFCNQVYSLGAQGFTRMM